MSPGAVHHSPGQLGLSCWMAVRVWRVDNEALTDAAQQLVQHRRLAVSEAVNFAGTRAPSTMKHADALSLRPY